MRGIGVRIALAPAFFGMALILFALSRSLALSLAVLMVIGFAQLTQFAGSNVVLQRLVEEDKRGRVMSLYTLVVVGIAPLGSLLAGFLTDRIGAPRTLLLGAPFCILGSVLFGFQLPHLRRKAIRALKARGEIMMPRASYRANVLEGRIVLPGLSRALIARSRTDLQLHHRPPPSDADRQWG